jgi:hypothetical protein
LAGVARSVVGGQLLLVASLPELGLRGLLPKDTRAALSILLEIPLNHHQDAQALLLTLMGIGWRHLPARQCERVGHGMARYVADCIAGLPFAPFTLTGARA